MVSLDFRHFWNYPIPKIIQNFGDFFFGDTSVFFLIAVQVRNFGKANLV